VPSHGDPFEDVESVVDANLSVIDSVETQILDGLHGKETTSDAVKRVCDYFGISNKRVSQYYLMNTAIMAYLSSLNRRGKLALSVEDNVQYWHKP